MKRKSIIATVVAMSLGLATPAMAQSAEQLLKGTAIGAGGGALAGAVLPGVSTGNGALIGAAGGAAYTALKKNKKYYRDSRGRKYYIDKRGYRRYK
ncbi:YMGG-like glycine zipper-containing protein [uncultured Sphingomonas sp.]|uniref:YMGG-like glycine zipper-containing protein n=1 Tax=uncultured Sphingomonas sp. TaxID=158754 RepID=UPI0025DAA9F6|nr:YMGG-like glycine zipper-containing protein [uncultured Sphingomonas sp.]